jgi:predicted DNA-binding transcriptional regulator AlpA
MKLLSFDDLKPEKGIPDSRQTVWRKVKRGVFPAPVKHGSRNAWPEHEIDQYIESLVAERDEAVA